MTAILVPVPGGRVGVKAPLPEWQAAGHFMAWPASPGAAPVFSCAGPDEARRMADYVNRTIAARAERQAASAQLCLEIPA